MSNIKTYFVTIETKPVVTAAPTDTSVTDAPITDTSAIGTPAVENEKPKEEKFETTIKSNKCAGTFTPEWKDYVDEDEEVGTLTCANGKALTIKKTGTDELSVVDGGDTYALNTSLPALSNPESTDTAYIVAISSADGSSVEKVLTVDGALQGELSETEFIKKIVSEDAYIEETTEDLQVKYSKKSFVGEATKKSTMSEVEVYAKYMGVQPIFHNMPKKVGKLGGTLQDAYTGHLGTGMGFALGAKMNPFALIGDGGAPFYFGIEGGGIWALGVDKNYCNGNDNACNASEGWFGFPLEIKISSDMIIKWSSNDEDDATAGKKVEDKKEAAKTEERKVAEATETDEAAEATDVDEADETDEAAEKTEAEAPLKNTDAGDKAVKSESGGSSFWDWVNIELSVSTLIGYKWNNMKAAIDGTAFPKKNSNEGMVIPGVDYLNVGLNIWVKVEPINWNFGLGFSYFRFPHTINE